MSKRASKQTDPEVTSSAARETIRKNYAAIERVVSVESILPKLFARKVIGEYEKQEIEAGKTPFQKSHTLADSMTRKSGKQFEEFCCILEETRVYTEFAHALRSQYAEEIATIEGRKGRGAVIHGSCVSVCICVCICMCACEVPSVCIVSFASCYLLCYCILLHNRVIVQ